MIRTMMARGQLATYLPTGELCKIDGCVNAGYDGWLYSLRAESDGRLIEDVRFTDLKRVTADVLPIKREI